MIANGSPLLYTEFIRLPQAHLRRLQEDSAMNESAFAHRKGKLTLHITDKAGKPLANAAIRACQTNTEFLFGCGAFDALPATAPENHGDINFYQDNINSEKAFYLDRVQKWQEAFNYGTLPFYWGGFEPEEGNVLTQSRMDAAKFLTKDGKTKVKGHPLCWHTVCADWLMEYDNKTILKKQLDRIYRDVSDFKGIIDIWDVINEVVIMPNFDRYDNAITRICREYGQVNLVKMVFDAAKQTNPDAQLLINDFNVSEDYRKLIADCLDAGAPISAIGIQTHQHQGYIGREKLEEILDRFSGFGLPIHFTENTLISGDLMPPHIVDLNDYQVDVWPTTAEGEERQRKQWREMYEILFAHPLVEAVTGWDFADGAWLHAPSGLIREDNTLKPAYFEVKKLAQEEWRTDTVIHTDANGCAVLEGFRGSYALTCGDLCAELTLSKSTSDCAEITMK